MPGPQVSAALNDEQSVSPVALPNPAELPTVVSQEPNRPALGPNDHVVLIGIDVYTSGVPALGGCVNDIDAIQELLIRRFRVDAHRIRRFAAPLDPSVPRPSSVPTEKPTRRNLISALAALGGEQVQAGDRVLIYYSGHGTQRYVQAVDGSRYYREALVPTDNRIWDEAAGEEREQLLFDWELNELLQKIAARTTSVTVILDCCCSAGATRSVTMPDVHTRYVSFAEPFILPADIAPPALPDVGQPAARGLFAGLAGSISECMVVAACLDDEKARESVIDPITTGNGGGAATIGEEGRYHGELTRALLAQIDAIPDSDLSELRWARIWRGIVAAVSSASPHQHPWLSSNPARGCFCSPPEEGDIGYTVEWDAQESCYRLNAGSLVGVTPKARVALYPAVLPPPESGRFPPLGSAEDLAARIGLVEIKSSGRATSFAEAVSSLPSLLPPGVRGRLVRAGTGAALQVSLSPNDTALAARIATRIVQSPLLELAPKGLRGDVILQQRADTSWALTDDIFGSDEARGEPILCIIPADIIATEPEPGTRDRLVAVLEHYRAYSIPLRLARNCTDLPHCLRVSLLDCSSLTAPLSAAQADDYIFPELQPERWPSYELKAGRLDPMTKTLVSKGDVFAVRIDNSSEQDLYVTLVNCDSDGRVTLYGSRVEVAGRSQKRFWFENNKGSPILAVLEEGKNYSADQYVAIGTTNRKASFDYLAVGYSFNETLDGMIAKGGVGLGSPELWTSAIAVLKMSSPR